MRHSPDDHFRGVAAGPPDLAGFPPPQLAYLRPWRTLSSHFLFSFLVGEHYPPLAMISLTPRKSFYARMDFFS